MNRMPVVFAQALGEYVLGSLASGVQDLTDSISTWLGSLSETTWMIIAASVAVAFVLSTRR